MFAAYSQKFNQEAGQLTDQPVGSITQKAKYLGINVVRLRQGGPQRNEGFLESSMHHYQELPCIKWELALVI